MEEKDHLHILWTNADIDTSRFMVFMYARNGMLRGWWKKVTIIIWGATARLAAESPDIKEEIAIAMQAGIEFSACVACAERLGVVEELKVLGIEVKPWGGPLTALIKGGESLITV